MKTRKHLAAEDCVNRMFAMMLPKTSQDPMDFGDYSVSQLPNGAVTEQILFVDEGDRLLLTLITKPKEFVGLNC